MLYHLSDDGLYDHMVLTAKIHMNTTKLPSGGKIWANPVKTFDSCIYYPILLVIHSRFAEEKVNA